MVCLQLIVGSKSPWLWQLAPVLLLLGLLVCTVGCGLFAWTARKSIRSQDTETESNTIELPIGRTANTGHRGVIRTLLILLAGVLAGGIGGYALRNQQLISSTQTLANVLVLQKTDDYSFRLQTEAGQAFNARFCSDGPAVDFEPGEKMKLLNYEQRKDCKSVTGKNLGFVFYTDRNGNRLKFSQEAMTNGN